MLTLSSVKSQAVILKSFLWTKEVDIAHSTCLHAVAKMHGHKNWNTLKGLIGAQIATDIEVRCMRLKKLATVNKNSDFHSILQKVVPLKIKQENHWSIHNHPELFDADDELDQAIYQEVINLGSRPLWEMEQVLPDLEQYADDYCPIIHGLELYNSQGFKPAYAHFTSLIQKEPRCIDAYVHIGNMYFNLGGIRNIEIAQSYYKKGVAMGLLTIGKRINDVLPWGKIDNRPFLRCLHGFGLCFLEQANIEDALVIFKQSLLLNPVDDQGIRFLIANPQRGEEPEFRAKKSIRDEREV